MRTVALGRLRRGLGALLLAAGVVHLVVPARLLGLARRSYRRLLAVEFRPRPGAVRRVRLVGALMCLLGVALRRRG